jgi:hypothetical protein
MLSLKIEEVPRDEEDVVSFITFQYETYSMKQLFRIAEFYDLPKCKTKVEMIKRIVDFETLFDNYAKVIERKEIWCFFDKMSRHPKMKKYIII